MKRVVITGLGAITPLGNTVAEYWKNLLDGVSGASLIDRFDTSEFKTKFACQVKDFDPSQYMDRSLIRKSDLFTQYALASTAECLNDANFVAEEWDLNHVGVIWATGVGGIQTMEESVIEFTENNQFPRFSPFFITKMIPNMAAGQISITYGLKGPTHSVSSACASSNNAISEAFNLIRLGKATAILAGGSEAPITMSSIGGFNSAKAMSTRNEMYKEASSPFDKNRDGFVMGEGAGVLLLEELEHALKRGAKIYCEVGGTGLASDAYHVTATHPEGLGALRAMQEAISEAGLTTTDVDYINAHATSTPVGDPSECKAIEALFGDHLDKLNISATKSMTGHLLGAAGAIEAVACVMSIYDNQIPPTINLKEPDPEFNPRLNFTANKSVKKQVDVALNNTFGFGGHIAVSLFKRYKNQ